MKGKHEIIRLRNITFLYIAIIVSLMGFVIFLFLISPLIGQFIDIQKDKFYNISNAKKDFIELYLTKCIDIAKQIGSCSMMRHELERYNKGKISLKELVDFTSPKLKDAMIQAKDVKGVARFSKNNQLLLNIGTHIPEEFFEKGNTNSIWISDPFVINKNYYIVIILPILNRNLQKIGKDMVLFDFSKIKHLINTHSKAFPQISIGLGSLHNEKPLFFFYYSRDENDTLFLKQGIKKAKDLKKAQMEIESIDNLTPRLIYYTPIKYTDWVLVSSLNKSLMFISIKKIVKGSFLTALFFILIGILGIAYIFYYSFIRKIIEKYKETEEEVSIKALRLSEEIQKRKTLEESYEIGMNLLGTLLDTVPLPIAVKEVKERRYILANKAFLELTRKGLKDIINKTTYDIWDKNDADIFEKLDNKVLETKSIVKYEDYITITKKGKLYGIITKCPFYDKNGNIIGIVSLFFDLTDRKKMEKELSRLATLVEQASEYIIITDLNGTIEYVNPAFTRITGFERSEAIGKNPRILKSGKHSKESYKEFWDTIKGGGTWSGEFINKRKNGEEYYDRTVAFSIRDKDGNIINLAAIKRDITEEKTRGKRLIQIEKMNTIGRLTGGIAHDFNNLLTIILGYSDFIINLSQDNPSINKYARKIKDTGDRARELIRKLLAFGRRQIYEPKVIDISKEILKLEKMLSRLIPEDIELNIDVKPNLPYIYADPVQIEQIIMNLVINARDAIREKEKTVGRSYKKVITIETMKKYLDHAYVKIHPGSRIGDFILISLTDNGIGMDHETMDRVFEPFFTTKEEGKGTGLGLSTVYGIIKQNNGMIYVYSEPGKGTTFKVYWPITEKEEKEIKKEEKIGNTVYGNETILVVEDNDNVRDLIVSSLKNMGYKIYEAQNGKEALELLKTKKIKPDLLITDVIMPEINGEELSKNIEKFIPDIKILFISGYTYNHIVHEGILKENINFLHKPFSPYELTLWVRKVLEKK